MEEGDDDDLMEVNEESNTIRHGVILEFVDMGVEPFEDLHITNVALVHLVGSVDPIKVNATE
jgi:hypothetical protein